MWRVRLKTGARARFHRIVETNRNAYRLIPLMRGHVRVEVIVTREAGHHHVGDHVIVDIPAEVYGED